MRVTQDQLYGALADPNASPEVKRQAIQVLDPRLKGAPPGILDQAVESIIFPKAQGEAQTEQTDPSKVPPGTPPRTPSDVPSLAPSIPIPSSIPLRRGGEDTYFSTDETDPIGEQFETAARILRDAGVGLRKVVPKTVRDVAADVGNAAMTVLEYPGEKLVQGLHALGVPVDQPFPSLSVEQPMASVPPGMEQPVPEWLRNYVAPERVGDPSERPTIADITKLATGIAFPFGGAVGATKLAGKLLNTAKAAKAVEAVEAVEAAKAAEAAGQTAGQMTGRTVSPVEPGVESGVGPGVGSGLSSERMFEDRPSVAPLPPGTTPPRPIVDPMEELSVLDRGLSLTPKSFPQQTPEALAEAKLAALKLKVENAPAAQVVARGATPEEEVLRATVRGERLGVRAPVTPQQAEDIQQIVEDANRLKSPKKGFESADEAAFASVIAPKSPATFPSGFRRAFSPALDVLKEIRAVDGTVVPSALSLRNLLWGHLDQVEREATHILGNVHDEFSRILGAKSWVEQKVARYGNPFLNFKTEHFYNNFTAADKDQLVNFLYSGGKTIPTGDHAAQIIELGQVFFEKGTKGTSILAREAGVTIPDLANPGHVIPYGSPEMFFPHIPITAEKIKALSGLRAKQFYESARASGKFEGSFQDFKDNVLAPILAARNGQIQAGYFGWAGKARGFDASDFGNPAEVLRAFGYDTDPIRALFRYNTDGIRSARAKMIEGQANALATDVKTAIGEPHTGWVDLLLNRTLTKPPLEYAEKLSAGAFHKFLHFNNATLLQAAAPSQIQQLLYMFGRAGVSDTIGAAVRVLQGDVNVSRSGALFSNIMNVYMHQEGMAQASTGLMRAYGFTAADNALRSFAAAVGDDVGKRMAERLIANPQNPRALNFFREMRIDPKDVIEHGGLTDVEKDLVQQNWANLTNGRSDIRTLPLWLTNDNPWYQLLTQFKKFLFNNQSELRRQVFDAEVPIGTRAARATRLTVGAGVLGELGRELQLAISHQQNPLDLPGEQRVSRPLRELYKTSPAAALIIDRVLYGYGATAATLAYASIESHLDARLEFMTGPTIGGGTHMLADWAKGVQGTISPDEHPKAWKPFAKDIGRRIPFIGPFTGKYIDEAYEDPFQKGPIQPIRAFDLEE